MAGPRKAVADRTLEEQSEFNVAVPPRADREHSKWSQHATSKGCLYKLLRRIEFMAAKHGGFFFERAATTARKIGCDRWMVWYLKKLLREAGVISGDRWGTNQLGHRVRGFDLAPHAEHCNELDGLFVCILEHDPAAQRLRFGHARPTLVQHPSNVRLTPVQQNFVSNLTAGPTGGPTLGPTVVQNQVDMWQAVSEPEPFFGSAVGRVAGMTLGVPESLESVESLESLESRPKLDTANPVEASARENLFSPDLDGGRMTVSRYFAGASYLGEFLDRLTDNEFETPALARYEHTEPLLQAIYSVVAENENLPLRDRKDLAVLCGSVMDRLRDEGMNAPKYWTKMLRTLRLGGKIRAIDFPTVEARTPWVMPAAAPLSIDEEFPF